MSVRVEIRAPGQGDTICRPIDKKLRQARSSLTQLVQELTSLEYTFKWSGTVDYARLAACEENVQVLVAKSFGPTGYHNEMATLDEFLEAKRLELEIMRVQAAVKRLKQPINLDKLKAYEKEVPEVLEQEEEEISSPRKPEYGLWHHVPRHLTAYQTGLSKVWSDPYDNTTKVATALEKLVGQKIWRFIDQLDASLDDFCLWDLQPNDDIGLRDKREAFEKLYVNFRGLNRSVGVLNDGLTPYLRTFIHGIAFTLVSAKSRLTRLQACSQEQAFATLAVIQSAKKALGQERDVVAFYSMHKKLQEAKEYEYTPSQFDRFLQRTHKELARLIANARFELDEDAKLVPAKILRKGYLQDHVRQGMPPEIVRYLANKMVHSLVHGHIDMELELARYAIQIDPLLQSHYFYKLASLKGVIEAYDQMVQAKRATILQDLPRACSIACEALSVTDIYGYARCMERMLREAPSFSEESRPLLGVLGRYIQREGYPVVLPLVDVAAMRHWAVFKPVDLFKQLSLVGDYVTGTTQQFFESLVFRLVCSAMYGPPIEKIIGQLQLSGFYNLSEYQSYMMQLSPHVRELINQNSINKLLAYSPMLDTEKRGILTDVEMKFFEEGPIKALFAGSLNGADVPLWLLPLVKMERVLQVVGEHSVTERLKKRWKDQEFDRWIAEDLPQGSSVDEKVVQEYRKQLLQAVKG